MTPLSSLRPLSVGQILDRAIRIYRHGLLPFTLIALVLIGPSLLVELLLPPPGAGTFVDLLVSYALSSFVTGMLASAAVAVYRGEPIVRDRVVADGRGSYWRVLVASILMGIIVALPNMVIGGVLTVVLLATRMPGEAAVVIAVALVLPLLMFLGAKYAVVYPAIVVEGCGSSDAMSRSWELSRGHFWRILATYGAATLLTLMIATLPSLGYGALSGAISGPGATVSNPVSSLLSSLGQLVSQPLHAIVAVVLYYDLRVRKEGFALEQAIEQLAAEPDPAA